MSRHLLGYVCVECGAERSSASSSARLDAAPSAEASGLDCSSCGAEASLEARYDYAGVAESLDRSALERREPWMWRYRELLPLDELAELPPLQVGMTPIYGAPRLAAWAGGIAGLWLKDDARGPTGAAEDRAAALLIAAAREAGRRAVALAAAGEATVAFASFAASHGLAAFGFSPGSATDAVRARHALLGSTLLEVAGDARAASALCREACARFGWLDCSPDSTPLFVEGMKTLGLEIGEQLAGRPPDWVVVPCDDSWTALAVYKGLAEMRALGLCKSLPRLLGVQTEDDRASEEAARSEDAPALHARSARALRASSGALVRVSAAEVEEAQSSLARLEGLLTSRGGALAMAGLRRAIADRLVDAASSVLAVVGSAWGSGPTPARAKLRPLRVTDIASVARRVRIDPLRG